MKTSIQDRRYLEVEADDFFVRNFSNADPTTLRPPKRRIVAQLDACGITPKKILEYGCNYGDLLAHYGEREGALAYGVEPSAQAVAFGKRAYGERVTLYQGTMADNPLALDPRFHDFFDLVIVDDVFCWVSRETLFQSIANLDEMLAPGGHLFVREFAPLANRRNRNHHIDQGDVFCFKPRGPHSTIFTASGCYEIVWQEISMDRCDAWLTRAGADAFEARWADTLLRKSYVDYFTEGAP